MKTLNLVQGSDEWLEARLNHFTASEAPAMMNQSKHMSRNQLLDLKKGWQSNPDSSFKEKLYSDGHKFEDLARPIIEMNILVELPPLVGSREIQGMELLASFDGLNINSKDEWEHKGWNETLAENARNGVLEPHYWIQLEHQMLVAGNEKTMFTVSDGTTDNMVNMGYISVPERRLEIIAAWKQFEIDLEAHQLEAKKETVVATVIKALPVIRADVEGTDIVSNIGQYVDILRERSQSEMNRVLENDQDFANKDTFNKAVKKAREELKLLAEKTQNRFQSHAAFVASVKEADTILQKMQSHGEKQVKDAKEAKKIDIVNRAITKVTDYMQKIEESITPIALSGLMNCSLDYNSAMKGKRTIESLQNAVDSVLAEWKIEANQVANKVKENLLTLQEQTKGYEFLFNDKNQLVTKDNEDLIAVIKTRISDHETAEKEKREAQLEEERKQIRIEEERKATEKAETEQKVALIKRNEEIINDQMMGYDHLIADKETLLVMDTHDLSVLLKERKDAEIERVNQEETESEPEETQAEKNGRTQTRVMNERENDPDCSVQDTKYINMSLKDFINEWASGWDIEMPALQELSAGLKERGLL